MPADEEDPSAAGDADRRAAEALSVQISGVPVERPVARAWRAKTGDGQPVALVVLRDDVPPAERARFGAAAERLQSLGGLPGFVHVRSLSPSRDAYLADLWTTGTAKDLGVFQWPPRRRLEFVKAVALALDSLHKAGAAHGCLCEENVLLADDLTPVLAEAGSVSLHALVARGGDAASYVAFAAPEVNEGAEPDARSDVYGLGRLMQHVLREDDVPQVTAIIRRCVAPAPAGRYASAAAVGAAIDAAVEDLPKIEAPAPLPAATPSKARAPSERKVEAPDVSEPVRDDLQPPPRWPAPVGALMVVASVAGAFLGAGTSPTLGALLVGVLAIGVALVAWAVLPPRHTPKALRIAFALALAAVVAGFNPLDYASRSAATRTIAHGRSDSRRAAVAEIMQQLGGDFRGMSLAGVDLTGVDLHGANLRDVDLSRANLSSANLSGTELADSSFEGATLFGADMRLSFGFPRHFGSAACDAKTVLPGPWRCINGHPKDGSTPP